MFWEPCCPIHKETSLCNPVDHELPVLRWAPSMSWLITVSGSPPLHDWVDWFLTNAEPVCLQRPRFLCHENIQGSWSKFMMQWRLNVDPIDCCLAKKKKNASTPPRRKASHMVKWTILHKRFMQMALCVIHQHLCISKAKNDFAFKCRNLAAPGINKWLTTTQVERWSQTALSKGWIFTLQLKLMLNLSPDNSRSRPFCGRRVTEEMRREAGSP